MPGLLLVVTLSTLHKGLHHRLVVKAELEQHTFQQVAEVLNRREGGQELMDETGVVQLSTLQLP